MVCDVGPSLGIGHLMRCIALGEEFQARGLEVRFSAEVAEVPWAAGQLARRGMTVVEPAAYGDVAGLVALVDAERPDVLVVDSYLWPREAYAALRTSDRVLLALVDGDPDGRVADVYLDQNIGAELDAWALADGSVRLAGLDHALIRNDLLEHRPAQPVVGGQEPPRVFTFFGGTDAFGAAPVLTSVLVATGAPFRATVVAATDELAAAVRAVEPLPGQRVEAIGPSDRLAEQVAAADLVVSAAGSSSWELCCLGAAAALICVADNQVESYRRAVDLGVVAGLGALGDLRADATSAVGVLTGLLRDPEARAALRQEAWRLVDGRGRRRVVDAVVARLAGATT
jgi:spore coat polysaccharide biosynthesis predicted glycosyltransferase SpsG